MNKYRFLLLILILCLTGCSFEYNVEITDDTVNEDNVIYIENSNEVNIEDKVENLVNNYTGPTNSLGMYDSSVVNKNNYFGMSYKESYNLRDYNNSVTFSLCYDAYKILKEDNEIIIATSSEFKCFEKYKELENVTVNLFTKYEIVDSNADNTDNNTLTWHINKTNATNKKISATINTNNIVVNENKINNYDLMIVIVGVILLITIILVIVGIKGKIKNKI